MNFLAVNSFCIVPISPVRANCIISSPGGIEPLGGSGRKLFISTSFGGVGVPLPFEAEVEPEVWPGLGPHDSGEVLVDIFGVVYC